MGEAIKVENIKRLNLEVENGSIEKSLNEINDILSNAKKVLDSKKAAKISLEKKLKEQQEKEANERLAKQRAEEAKKKEEEAARIKAEEEARKAEEERIKAEEAIKEKEVSEENNKSQEDNTTEETKEEPSETKPKEDSNKLVIEKTENPNIILVNGKRVFVPNARRDFVSKIEPTKNRPNNINKDRKPFDKNNPNNKNAKPNNKPNLKDKGYIDAPTFVPVNNNNVKNKKKTVEKNSYEDKKAVNKKALAKGQSILDNYNEDMTGYRKIRKVKEKHQEAKTEVKIDKAVVTKEIMQIKELSEIIGVQAVEITKMLFKEGIMKTINDSIDYDTAGFIAANLGIELELKLGKTAEDKLNEGFDEALDDASNLVKRSPIVTVMGHVDHGKTSLLDYIRKANVTAGEAGGITQHIGAYTASVNGESITFLDTPGHAAFTAMRARGAQVTDIAVIVVAADDSIMPQTIEAINHAKAAGVTIIIAANKMDKPTANIEKVKKDLADQEVLVEEWGGDVALVPVSAKTGQGIDKLLETILLTAEMMELKANPNRLAKGSIVEAKLDKGKGPVATVLIQTGTLKVGDYLVAGTITGKVRAMTDDKGMNIKEAGPSTPVAILGLDEVPNAGDSLFAVEEAKLSSLVANERKNKEREEMIKNQQKVSLDDLFAKVQTGDLQILNVIVKADVQGSVEAVRSSIEELSNDQVKVQVIHAAVGAISETDVSLADSSNSIIIGFNVRPDSKAKDLAERSKVEIKLYRIIYEALEDIENALKGMVAPKFKDVYQGKAEVRDVFKISNVGMVAGCYVTEGKILRSGKLRIYRNDVMICEGNVLQLKRFKDDVKEVAQGFECGISIEKFDGIEVGDFIECYTIEEDK